jgi:nucleoside 2-deoxyribosyltransferase
MAMLRIYLAGPEVFLPNARALGEAKRALCADLGLSGVFPLDADIDLGGLPPREQGRTIYRADVSLMRRCDVIIANLTPFRGPSADVGTAFELGFMTALGKPAFAYSNCAESFIARMARVCPSGLHRRIDGQWADQDDLAVEDFDMLDNLMLHGALAEGDLFLHQAPAGQELTDLTAFESCVKAARRLIA